MASSVFRRNSYVTRIGHYMLATAPVGSVVEDTARLLSPLYPATTLCTQFWYKTDGNSHLNLKSYLFGVLSKKSFFTFKGGNGNEWAFAQSKISNPYSF
jgi:hypothetical protein